MGSRRIVLLRRLLVLGLLLLVARLGYVQLVRGAAYRQLAEQNRLRIIPQAAARGLVLDRHGRRLAASHTEFRLAAAPQDVAAVGNTSRGSRRSPQDDATAQIVFARLSRLVDRPAAELQQQFVKSQTLPFLPATLLNRLPKSVALRVEEARVWLPGVLVDPVTSRSYPLGSVAAHLLGYVGKPSAEAYPTLKHYGVRPQDLVGRAGLEHELDAYLRGQSGGSLIEVNHRGRQVRVVGYRQPVPGEPVVLTVDAQLQALIEQQFGSQPGAAVVLAPQTGEVLAMASTPSFDPAVFARQDQRAIEQLLPDPAAPLMNRAAVGMYLPGSIVKVVTAMTGLEHRLIDSSTTVSCPGFLTIGNRRFHCWNRDGHGSLALRDALVVSCNVYFMHLGRRLGLARLRAGFSNVGFGRRTGWLFDEQPGHLPGGRRLTEGEVALLAMGQGEILVTPLQVAVMVSAIANQGWLVEPWVVERIGARPIGKTHLTSIGWSKAHLRMVREGMLAVVNDPRGTGIRAHSDLVTIAGKTGTAQTHLSGKTHGWFIGFCPANDPIAAMAIVAEYGGTGGELPATIGKAACEHLVAATGASPKSPVTERTGERL